MVRTRGFASLTFVRFALISSDYSLCRSDRMASIRGCTYCYITYSGDVRFGSVAVVRRNQKSVIRTAGMRPSPDGRIPLLYVNLL